MSAWLTNVAFLQPTEGWFDECNGLQRLVGYLRLLQCLGEMSCEISGDHFTCHEDWKGVCWGRNEPWMDHERTQVLRFTSQKNEKEERKSHSNMESIEICFLFPDSCWTTGDGSWVSAGIALASSVLYNQACIGCTSHGHQLDGLVLSHWKNPNTVQKLSVGKTGKTYTTITILGWSKKNGKVPPVAKARRDQKCCHPTCSQWHLP